MKKKVKKTKVKKNVPEGYGKLLAKAKKGIKVKPAKKIVFAPKMTRPITVKREALHGFEEGSIDYARLAKELNEQDLDLGMMAKLTVLLSAKIVEMQTELNVLNKKIKDKNER